MGSGCAFLPADGYSHQPLDRGVAFQAHGSSRGQARRAIGRSWWPTPGAATEIARQERSYLIRPSNLAVNLPRSRRHCWGRRRLSQSDDFLMAFAGPRHPRTARPFPLWRQRAARVRRPSIIT